MSGEKGSFDLPITEALPTPATPLSRREFLYQSSRWVAGLVAVGASLKSGYHLIESSDLKDSVPAKRELEDDLRGVNAGIREREYLLKVTRQEGFQATLTQELDYLRADKQAIEADIAVEVGKIKPQIDQQHEELGKSFSALVAAGTWAIFDIPGTWRSFKRAFSQKT